MIIVFSINDSSYALENQNLAPQIAMTVSDFKERFRQAYDLLDESGAIEHIEKEVEKAGGIINLNPRADSVDGDIDIMVVPIPGLLDREEQIAHVDAAASAGTPVIYIDSKFFYDEDSLRDAKKVIADDGSRSPGFKHTEPPAPNRLSPPPIPSALPIPQKRFECKFQIQSQDIVRKATRYAEYNGMRLDKNTEKDGGYTVYSLYLESHALKTFYDRENGVPDRFKARIRYYGDGRIAILELKNRVKGVGMWKNRAFIKMEHVKDVLAGRVDYNWLLKPDDPRQRMDLDMFVECMQRYDLKPHVYVAYERLAYVSNGPEKNTSNLRITFDSNVRVAPFDPFTDLRALPTDFPDSYIVWPSTTIMEVKFTPPYYPKWVQDMVVMFSLEKSGAGKYCDGVKIAHALVPGNIRLTGLPLTMLADRALSNIDVRDFRRFEEHKAMKFTAALAVFEELLRSKSKKSSPPTVATAIRRMEVSGADPAEILRSARDTDGLLREAAIGKGIIIDNAVAASVLSDLGIIDPAEEKGAYRFSDIMIGADLNYTRTMINVVNDVRYNFGKDDEEVILARRDVPQDIRIFARELIRAALLHRINSVLEPAIPDGKIVWHIIESDLIPIEQKASLVTQTNKVFRESGLRERIRILREGETVEEAIKAIKDEYGGDRALFDVALSDVNHIDSVPAIEGGEPVRMLVFDNPGAAFVQLEGIVAALRALYAPNDEAIARLLKIYSAVCEMPFPQDAVPPPALLDDPRSFARSFVFKLPPIKRIQGDDIKNANDRLVSFLMSA